MLKQKTVRPPCPCCREPLKNMPLEAPLVDLFIETKLVPEMEPEAVLQREERKRKFADFKQTNDYMQICKGIAAHRLYLPRGPPMAMSPDRRMQAPPGAMGVGTAVRLNCGTPSRGGPNADAAGITRAALERFAASIAAQVTAALQSGQVCNL